MALIQGATGDWEMVMPTRRSVPSSMSSTTSPVPTMGWVNWEIW